MKHLFFVKAGVHVIHIAPAMCTFTDKVIQRNINMFISDSASILHKQPFFRPVLTDDA